MNKRPLSVTIVGCIFVATGIIGAATHAAELRGPHPFASDVVWAIAVNLVAIVCGVYLLRRNNWARWLTVGWLAFHVVLSLHSQWELLVHSALLAVFAYLLFRAQATAYFRPATT